MSAEQLNITGADTATMFSVGDLLDLIVSFEYPFEGQKLKGRWRKYKTSTRSYVKTKQAERQQQLQRWAELQKQIEALAPGDPQIDTMIAECEKLDEAAQRTNVSWLSDALVEWNAVGRDKNVIPFTPAGLADIPVPFLVKFAQFLVDSRTDENPASPDS
jgi:hypothetical protein